MSNHVDQVANSHRSQFDTGSFRSPFLFRRAGDRPISCHGADPVKTPIHPSSDRRLSPDRSAGKSGPPPPFRRGPDSPRTGFFCSLARSSSFAKPMKNLHAIRHLTRPRRSRVFIRTRLAPEEKYRCAEVENGGRPCYCLPATVASTKGCNVDLRAWVPRRGGNAAGQSLRKILKRGAIAGSWPRWE